MHWVLVDTKVSALVETLDTEDEGLQAVHEMLAVNSPDLIEFLALGAMYDEDEPHDVELPPVLEGEALKARLTEWVQRTNADASRNVHQKIRRWLTEEGWTVRDIDDPRSSFNVMVTLAHDQGISLIESKDRPGHIEIVRRLEFGKEFQSEFSQLPESIQQETLWNIHHDWAIIGVEFDGPKLPLTETRFYASIYFDGLIKDMLVQRISLVLRAVSLAVWTFARGFENGGRSGDVVSRSLRLVSSAA